MFGYVKPQVPELRVKENEFYRALYCGLCRAQGNKSPFLSLTLSYDFVFLALTRLAVSDDKIEFGKKRCVAHPLKKRAYVKDCSSLDYTAATASILLYYNLKDDVNDKKGLKKAAASMVMPQASHLRKKFIGDGVLDRAISENLAVISEREHSNCSELYELAEPFGILLGTVFAYGIEDESVSRILYQIGRHVGRWIYIADALDDIEKDRKSGSFNPFVVSDSDSTPEFYDNIKTALIMELEAAGRAFELLEIGDPGIRAILANIIYLGMPAVIERIINKKLENTNTKHKSGEYK